MAGQKMMRKPPRVAPTGAARAACGASQPCGTAVFIHHNHTHLRVAGDEPPHLLEEELLHGVVVIPVLLELLLRDAEFVVVHHDVDALVGGARGRACMIRVGEILFRVLTATQQETAAAAAAAVPRRGRRSRPSHLGFRW